MANNIPKMKKFPKLALGTIADQTRVSLVEVFGAHDDTTDGDAAPMPEGYYLTKNVASAAAIGLGYGGKGKVISHRVLRLDPIDPKGHIDVTRYFRMDRAELVEIEVRQTTGDPKADARVRALAKLNSEDLAALGL